MCTRTTAIIWVIILLSKISIHIINCTLQTSMIQLHQTQLQSMNHCYKTRVFISSVPLLPAYERHPPAPQEERDHCEDEQQHYHREDRDQNVQPNETRRRRHRCLQQRSSCKWVKLFICKVKRYRVECDIFVMRSANTSLRNWGNLVINLSITRTIGLYLSSTSINVEVVD